MNWFTYPYRRITASPMMPLSFVDAVIQAIHIDCSKEHINVLLDVPGEFESGRIIFLWRRDTNVERRCVLENRFEINPGGFILLEAYDESAYKIRRGMTGGVKDLKGFMPWIIRMPLPQFEQN